MGIETHFAEIRHAASRPQPRDHRRMPRAFAYPALLGQPLQHAQVECLRRGAQDAGGRARFQACDQRVDAGEIGLALAPIEVFKARKPVLLNRQHFLRQECPGAVVRQRTERAVALMSPGAAGDLRHLGHRQATLPLAVELVEAGERDVRDVHVQPHTDRIGRDQIIDLAGLEHRDLRVAGARR
jgi:hypothetical protein